MSRVAITERLACFCLLASLLLLYRSPAAIPASFTSVAAPAELALTTNLHRFITSRTPATAEAAMSAYTNTLPGTNVPYRMVPIRGGEFLMGSPDNEIGRHSDEGPQRKVRIEPFWMGVHEVTWNEYEVFLGRTRVASRPHVADSRSPYTNALADTVSLPSRPYIDP